ncbi:hypothetical protein CVT24_000596 [Panaeolus cyanescens]|uniref:F-box domain-containing protein n=1 Tax=Panaeolus cyanescens TaxID=181874 RepID=A0A409YDG4_9AGAR|nr:hypothetical protein CVT24_000596 [Panaeolus cyanescens]
MSDVNLATSMATNDTNGPVFPFDIFEIIIMNFITSPIPSQFSRKFFKPHPDINSLSLVSKSFAEICQPLLFKSVQIDIQFAKLNRTQQLAGVIKANPTLASYIKWLEYIVPNMTTNQSLDASKDGSLTPLLQLPRLQYLKISACFPTSYEDQESSMGMFGLRSLLDQYMVSSTLTTLHIRRITKLPILDVLSCPNLENLELRFCETDGWDHPAASEVLNKGFKLKTAMIYGRQDVALSLFAYCPQIERFEFVRMSKFRSERPEIFPMSAQPLVSFKNLTAIVSIESVDWSYFCRLAESAGVKAFPALKHLTYYLITEEDITLGINPIFGHMESLEELEIQALNHAWNPEITSLNLKRCFSLSAQTLKNITIKWKIVLESGKDLLKIIRMALEGISHTNVLQRLDIYCDIAVDRRNDLDFQQWNHLDLSLTADNGAAFPLLNEVRISLRLSTGLAALPILAVLPQPTMSLAENDTYGPVFPFEIFEIIINIIANATSPGSPQVYSGFSKSDLIALCLVSKSFAEICQPLLFKWVQIDIHSYQDRAQQLVGAIKANPTLASCIKWLEYREPNERPVEPIDAEKDGSLTPLLQLPRLQYLKVNLNGYGSTSYEGPESSMGLFGFRSLLDQYMASNTLTSLHVQDITELPILDIFSCPNLEDLELRYAEVKGWDHPYDGTFRQVF